MLEILIIIAVVKAFKKKAQEKNLNQTIWGIFGALSYYLPILLMTFLIFPFLVGNRIIPVSTETEYMIYSFIVNIATGVACCFGLYQVLKNTKSESANVDILDNDLK